MGQLLQATPDSGYRESISKDMKKKKIDVAWIGLNRINAKPNDTQPWRWDDNAAWEFPGPKDWAPGSPDMNSNKKCVALAVNQIQDNKYLDLYCENKLLSYCEEYAK